MYIKLLFLFFLLSHSLFGNEQLIVVLSDSFDTPKAQLQRYEKKDKLYTKVSQPINVNLGKNGLGWGESPLFKPSNLQEPQKREGDLKSPAGIFELGVSFGYNPTHPSQKNYIHTSPSLICVDDSDSKYYNQLVLAHEDVLIKSFEWMKREDDLYKLGVFVKHNPTQIANHGSCIFLHVQRDTNAPTSGCTSMAYNKLSEIVSWLESTKRPLLLQIPRQKCSKFERIFNGIDCTNKTLK